jgi:Tfp pilus assembly protein PilF/4-amino-4-deoxy-L-arabinose transferase-like glycosyltransferase
MAGTPLEGRRRAFDPWLAASLGLCFALRALHVLALRDHPLFEHPVVDAGTYLASARNVLEGGSFSIWQAPLYVYFMAGLLWIEDSLLFVRLAQALLSTGTCWIVYTLAARRAPRPVARGAALGYALYGTLIYFDGELLAEVLFLFLGLTALAILEWARRAQRGVGYLAGGLALGLTALARGTILPLAGFLLLWIALEGRDLRPRRALAAVLMLIGLALPIAVNALHNLRTLGEPILTSPASGISLYIGNNERAEETLRVRPGAAWNAMAWLPQRGAVETTGQLSRQEESAWFTARALEFARREPAMWLALLGRKVVRSASGEEIPRNLDLYEFRAHSPVLRCLLWPGPLWLPFGIVLPLALCGVWMRRGSWRTDLPLLGFALSTTAVCVVFFPTGRYRAPLAPIALIYAAVAAHAWWAAFRSGRAREALPGMVAALALGLFCNANLLPLRVPTAGEVEFYTGDRDLARGDLSSAEQHFRAAADARATYPDPHYGLALVHARRGQLAPARAKLERALAILPEFAEAHALLGDLQLAAGELAPAIGSYRASLEVKPTETRIRTELARALLQSGDADGALVELRIVLRDRPGNASAWTLAAEAQERRGEGQTAFESYARAVALDPRQARAHRALGRLCLERGERERARQHLSAALAIDPTDAESRALLDRL